VLLARARQTGAQVTVPASALAQAIRKPEHQAGLSRLVVICARRAGQPVVTSDPGDLSSLDPSLILITVSGS
jgi:hypothetical protein